MFESQFLSYNCSELEQFQFSPELHDRPQLEYPGEDMDETGQVSTSVVEAAPMEAHEDDLADDEREEMEATEEEAIEIQIRQVLDQDLLDVVKLFQAFDNDKYKFVQIPELRNNNNRKLVDWESRLPRLRIDKKGGIHLQPLLDSNNAYFKCYVAQDTNSQQLIGYILFFNTLDETAGQLGGQADDPVAVIEDLYVKPCYRGRGIGTQLFRRVLKASLDRGCSSCECLVIPKSKDGLHFWKRRIGENRIKDAMDQANMDRKAVKRKEDESDDENLENHELVVVLNKNEMVNYYQKTSMDD